MYGKMSKRYGFIYVDHDEGKGNLKTQQKRVVPLVQEVHRFKRGRSGLNVRSGRNIFCKDPTQKHR